jgi:glycerate kinase
MFLDKNKIKSIKLTNHSFQHWLELQERDNPGYLDNLASAGASGGVSGLTYYKETTALYDKFQDEIWKTLDEFAWNVWEDGEETVLSLLNAEARHKNIEINDPASFKNLAVWYYVEVKAQDMITG